ncbi:MAG: HAD-IIIC family phosphatase [Acidobacteriia bacterium]|nr:HAD-IIIC family phosphatase [Terriglobia bacterium]
MLDWLPYPHDFSAQLRDAVRADSAAERVGRLIALSQYRLDFLQTIQLNRAMDTILLQAGEVLPHYRLAILGSATVEHLAPAIRVAALRRQLWVDVYCCGYGQYRQEIMDPGSALHRFAPQTILFSIATMHAVPAVEPAATADEVDRLTGGVVEDLKSLWRRARQDLGAAIIHQTLLNVTEPLFGSFDRLVPGSPWRVVERLNHFLAETASAEGVSLLDIARAAQRDGQDSWFDAARMLQAKQEIAPQSAPMYGELVARLLGAHRGKSRKCLVLDLDNTLWGGVLGDDGVTGLVLGQGSAAGEAYLGVQRYARQLKERGIILAVCSKNDPVAAEEAFSSHPEMILKRSDIAAFMANWDDKAQNLEAIAGQLNIGLDSLVFLDDNPVERARVREALPVVAVPELPDDVSGYVRRLADAGYFEAISFTMEDQQRASQYSQNVERESMRGSAQSVDEFLQGLQMFVQYGPFAAVDLPRVTQLINKTNQFTPTTRRYSAEQIANYLSTAGTINLQFRLRDRFGDNGLVSAMLMLPVEGAAGCIEIDTWVMSCRVFGRQLEYEAMNIAVETARCNGIREIIATYIPTQKNSVIRDLYPKLGFRAANLPNQNPEASRWSLLLSEYIPCATHITREVRRP